MIVRQLTTLEELNPLKHAWNELAADVPFRSWDWLVTWWKHYGAADAADRFGASRMLNVFAVYEESPLTVVNSAADSDAPKPRLLAVFPWYLERSVLSGKVLRWLGTGEVCTDHLSVVCSSPQRLQAACHAVALALTADHVAWDRLDLAAIDTNDPAVHCLIDNLAQSGCGVTQQDAVATWAVELPPTWDEYLATISKSHRKQLRQLERRVLESDRAVWHRVQSPAELAEAWAILVDLHQRRRKSLGEHGCFASRHFHDFHRDLAARLLTRDALRLSWLELDGSPAAAEYHFAGGDTTYAYQGGVDPDRLAEEPGRLSNILWMRAAIGEGHRTVDFLRGDEVYKAHWRATPQATKNVRITPPRRLARFRGDVLTATGRMTDWVRRTRRQLAGNSCSREVPT